MCRAAPLLAALTLAVLVLAWAVSWRDTNKSGFCSGPANINLYDYPYVGYPDYEGEAAVAWDADRRCVAFCRQKPCTVWCR